MEQKMTFTELNEDWNHYKVNGRINFKDNLAEAMAFMSFVIGWAYARERMRK